MVKELYEFMKENEIHITERNEIIEILLFVNFWDMEEFVSAMGECWLEDDGMNCTLKDGYIVIDIADVLTEEGGITSYKDCFEERYWELYGEKIIEMEAE